MGTSIDAYMWFGTPAFDLPDDGEDEELEAEEYGYDKLEAVCKEYNLVWGNVGWEVTGFWIAGKSSVTSAYYGSKKVDPALLAVDTDGWTEQLTKAIEELNPTVWEDYSGKLITASDIGWHIGVNAG